MGEWKEYKIDEVAKISTGFAFSGDEYEFKGILRVVRGENVTIGNLRWDSEKYWNKATNGLDQYYLQENDIVIGMDGSRVGHNRAKIKSQELPLILAQRVARLRAKEGFDQEFLWYHIFSDNFKDYVEAVHTGTSIPHISQKQIADFEIFAPILESEQTAISSILSSLDDKIDLLHRQNATLEKLAETLFRKWFIEEAKDEWGTGKLGDEFDLTMGASPPGESYNEEGFGIPMYQGNADFGFRFPTNRVFTTDPKRFAEKYDTLVSVRAPVGEQNMANERCCIGRGVAAFRFKKDNSFYTYTYYKMKSLMNDIKQFNETGTVFGSISKSDFENIEIVIPDKISIHKFQNEAKPIDDKITTNTIQVRTLTALRDTLLPKLMSGEVRVEM